MMSTNQFPLLNQINSPEDLRKLKESQLPALAAELRAFLVDRLDQCGGHFGANLGAIELTIALHYLYDTPKDRLIWDVGHQAYPHKILTGRRDQIHTVKQANGLAPFPKRDESIYDCFGTGHSSTSIGAALGMAIASKLNHDDRKVIAIIGDGGLTGGQAFEALDHGGAIDPNLLVILNDNEMSISENVGALSHYLGRILSGKTYATFREGSKKILAKMPPISRLAKKTEEHLKGMIMPGTLFEELGFNYVGPIDGHDLPALLKTLRTLKSLDGPRFLHIVTVKGKGYPAAEAAQIDYHAVTPGFHSKTETKKAGAKAPTYTDVFSDWLCDMAAIDEQLIGITPAMREGSGLVRFAKEFPDRYFDVGIAEQHAMTFAAGLACEKKKPVVAIYSTFLQRGYDQLIHDIALQNLDVTFAIDRAGLVGADGPTHAGSFDLSFLRCIPNLVVMAPKDENESRQMLTTAFHYPGPAAVRYPRGTGPGSTVSKKLESLPIGKAEVLRHGKKIALLALGSLVTPALQAAETLDATVINMRFIKPLDVKTIIAIASTHNYLVTLEENTILGGAGSAIAEVLAAHQMKPSLLQLGLPDRFLDHGNPKDMLAACGLDAKGIIQSIETNQRREHVNATEADVPIF
ncbi:MAG: 1-deoxy-D-xylulose-5-phosphate synthase [Gammaproteobacteria bacterium RIFCSPLOWO2_02_FULL_42_14]|nr:MAG: 1-deoxy-D-xylulose-5-phosphate synthase [Gammaproteobacteria bacterium RIFCSPHIGHO2_02_FULL_42_43]OGT52549.1 MAG: 1-deoxy-D-xylulose-5-phosphate synthase [Gammaproteobacteria bacterium RIFCSPHIGHO2_12_FULL_41_25]OGT63147.1 MAG: 1-deoxy-D-xylulose-5-phosphate synthase [Gammaproteobacteria bacterium RIFCSPLOWO2_02_FULL_42_14]OGT86647.1 MAG: 1-deoxy-D-xylulose-5-phosphate synthase [Gammaproteobacteria bacterium RIFCSPLOWO2_12_FULL_42_18]